VRYPHAFLHDRTDRESGTAFAPAPGDMPLHRRPRLRRTIADVAIGVTSIAAVVACVMAIDGRASREFWRMLHGGGEGGSLPGHTAMLARSGWELAGMHTSMAVFATVAVVLVLCMVRMK
jgi:hypothetical protein